MEPIKGSPIYVGHRAYGSLAGYFLILFLIIGIALYLHFYDHKVLGYVLFTVYGVHITVLIALAIVFLIVLLVMYIRHRQWTYIITDRQVYVRKGIIAADTRNFLYDQVQEASSFQTIGQRILLWGQLNITMLITYTGQSKIEEAHMDYIHRPKHIANLMIARVKVGEP
jgi:uncharacterized membrane protein YdbT with pleckstrin-like domain